MTVVETDRLTLRRISSADAEFIVELLTDPAFLRFIGDRGVRSVDDAHRYIQNGPVESYERHGFGLYLVELKGDATPIGMCGLLKRESLSDVDLGYAFLPAFRGRGYALEAAAAVMDYGRKTVGLERIVAVVSPDNDGSIRVLERLGFRYERPVRMSADEPEIALFSCDAGSVC